MTTQLELLSFRCFDDQFGQASFSVTDRGETKTLVIEFEALFGQQPIFVDKAYFAESSDVALGFIQTHYDRLGPILENLVAEMRGAD